MMRKTIALAIFAWSVGSVGCVATQQRVVPVGWHGLIGEKRGHCDIASQEPPGLLAPQPGGSPLTGWGPYAAVKPGKARFECEAGAIEVDVREVGRLAISAPNRPVRAGETLHVRLDAFDNQGRALDLSNIIVGWQVSGPFSLSDNCHHERDTDFPLPINTCTDWNVRLLTTTGGGSGTLMITAGGKAASVALTAVP